MQLFWIWEYKLLLFTIHALFVFTSRVKKALQNLLFTQKQVGNVWAYWIFRYVYALRKASVKRTHNRTKLTTNCRFWAVFGEVFNSDKPKFLLWCVTMKEGTSLAKPNPSHGKTTVRVLHTSNKRYHFQYWIRPFGIYPAYLVLL